MSGEGIRSLGGNLLEVGIEKLHVEADPEGGGGKP
jgi:hypothetical protein